MTLASFGIEAQVVEVSHGPTVTRYEIQLSPGIKVSRIVALADDLALALAAPDVRIEAPVPGKSVVGVEVPNREPSPVLARSFGEPRVSGSPFLPSNGARAKTLPAIRWWPI